MEPQILNSNFINTGILEPFDSFIWIDRYCGFGNFEFITSDIVGTLHKLIGGQYLYLKESKHIMVLEDIEIDSDPVNGDKLKLRGRSLETILDRRIVWNQISFVGANFQDTIHEILNKHAINPDNADRKFARLIFEESVDPIITALVVDKQFYGEFIYDVILDLCKSKNVGFKIELNSDRNFVFKLYVGEDRSFSQIDNPWVIFSKEFDNLLSSQYKETSISYKTIALVAGEKGVSNQRTLVEVSLPSGSGTDLNRREMFVDAQSITRNVSGQESLTEEQYNDLLIQKGNEELAKGAILPTFEAQIDPTRTYIYGEDFFMGDIIQISDDYGHQKRSQITEVIHCQDGSGINIYPTFSALE